MTGISKLIAEITPLYNQYKRQNKTISGVDALGIMWNIGDILRKFVKNNNMAPYSLFNKIYGNSENTKNITQNSYIAREFQSRCFRIRRIFINKEEIEQLFPNLQKFRLFDRALPFFDGKYKLNGDEREKIIRLLNSSHSYKYIESYVENLKKEKINIKNPRTQRLSDLDSEKVVFVKFYNFIYHILKKETNIIISQLKNDGISKNDIRALAKNTNALSQDGLKFTKVNKENFYNIPLWMDYVEIIHKFNIQNNAKLVRRFRRIIPLSKIINLSDMLYTLSKLYD